MDENKYKLWCVTINESKDCPLPSQHLILELFTDIATTYVFQLEKGESTDNLHYQCAIRLKIRRRKSTLINIVKAKLLLAHQFEFSPMQGSWEENYAYCTKEDSAIDSPITNLPYYKGADIKFLDDLGKMYLWQQYLFNELFNSSVHYIKTPDDRKIYWFYDPTGNSGKSKFSKFLVLRNDTIVKVPFGTSTQLRSAIITAGPKRVYIVDIPRTLGKDDDMNSVISILEDLKNGFVVSSMYGKNAQILMDPPHVVVFSNRICPVDKMSSDRWIQVEINENKEPQVMKNGYNIPSYTYY